MSIPTSRLALPTIDAAQAQKHVTHNEALEELDILVQACVLDRDLATPPGSPALADTYIVAGAATGAWAGKENNLAAWIAGGWVFFPPFEGMRVWLADENRVAVFDGSTWGFELTVQSGFTDITAARLLAVGAFGLGSGVDTALGNIDDHQTSGFYFGYGGSHGSATAGTNPFPNFGGAFGLVAGTSSIGGPSEYLWQIAVSFGSAGPGVAWRSKSIDASGWEPWAVSYDRSNVVGTVSQSGGDPTGSIIEAGSNANGEYVRFADGTQICWKKITQTGQDITTAFGQDYRTGNLLTGLQSYPVSFFGSPPSCNISVHTEGLTTKHSIGGTGDVANTPSTVYALHHSSVSNRTIYVNIQAIGRWF